MRNEIQRIRKVFFLTYKATPVFNKFLKSLTLKNLSASDCTVLIFHLDKLIFYILFLSLLIPRFKNIRQSCIMLRKIKISPLNRVFSLTSTNIFFFFYIFIDLFIYIFLSRFLLLFFAWLYIKAVMFFPWKIFSHPFFAVSLKKIEMIFSMFFYIYFFPSWKFRRFCLKPLEKSRISSLVKVLLSSQDPLWAKTVHCPSWQLVILYYRPFGRGQMNRLYPCRQRPL